ncbi:hypothetical protein [Arthrobacter sp.]
MKKIGFGTGENVPVKIEPNRVLDRDPVDYPPEDPGLYTDLYGLPRSP